MQPKVTLITVNYNQTAVTCELLDSIRRQDYTNTEVIVVDNASREDPTQLLENQYPEVIVIRSETNLGFAGGNNLGIAEATGDLLFFVNNDTEIPPRCILKLVDLFAASPGLGAASPMVCYWNNPAGPPRPRDLIQYAGMTPILPPMARNETIGKMTEDDGRFTAPTLTAYPHGAAMMMTREVLEKVGLMAEDFFLYYEETDWGERIRRAGFDIKIEPRAKIYHKESVTVAKLGALKTYYVNRNRIYFMRRNFPGLPLWGFYAFYFAVTVPKNVFNYLRRGDMDNLKAFLQGIWWNFFPGENKFEAVRTGQSIPANSPKPRTETVLT